jgi:integrase
LHILKLFDKKFDEKLFAEIDIKYVKAFDIFLQKRGCKGNTRKYYFKALRSVLNKAIQDGEASANTYPFGKGGFNIAALEEETVKRYLPMDCMTKIKSTEMENHTMELTRRLFLFSYYCYGISFIDAAFLTKKNIIRYNGGDYIVYKRNKTKEAKKVKAIQIKVTPEIQSHLDWFTENAILIEDYLVPIVSRSGYKGEQLYNHIRSRFTRNNKNLKELAKALEITELTLTSYVSRHTMAMTLQDNQVPREIISQILGHSDLSTTNTYLDSFSSNIIDEAVRVL